METLEHAQNSLAGPLSVPHRTPSDRADHLPVVEQKRTELILVGLLTIFYALTVGNFEPAHAERPGAFLIHLILLLGTAVAFFGLWDCLALLALRHLLRRDRVILWRKYGHPRELQRRLENSTFERDFGLGGGLLVATLRRVHTASRTESDFIARHLSSAIRSSRIGPTFLAFATIAAPILGVLGAAVTLRASLSPAGEFQYTGNGLTLIVLGLSISLIALVFSRLLGTSLARDCASFLAPVAEASYPSGRTKARKAADGDSDAAFERRMQAWTSPPWSKELRRLRTASAAVSWLVIAALIFFVSLPKGLADQWFVG